MESQDHHRARMNTEQFTILKQEILTELRSSMPNEETIAASIEEVRRKQESDGRMLVELKNAVGESPDAATGVTGSGMRKQLALLVDASRKPTLYSAIAAIFAALAMVYQMLKGFGVLH